MTIKPVEIPSPMEGVQAYKYGRCRVLVDRRSGYWHMSISHHRQLPTWAEVRDARYALIPNEATMVMALPPKEAYVNIHEFCFHLWEIQGQEALSFQT